MSTNFIYINDVYFNNGVLEIISDRTSAQAVLENKDLHIKCKVNNNKIDIKEMILLNKIFLEQDGLYELKMIDEFPQILVVNSAPVTGKEYICKDYLINAGESKFNIDIYINNLNRIKIKISKIQEDIPNQKKLQNMIDNIQIDKEKLLFNLNINAIVDTEEDNEVLEVHNYFPNEVKFYLFDRFLENIVIIEPKNIDKNIFAFEFDIANILETEVEELKLVLVLDDEKYDYLLKQKMKLKKFVLNYGSDIKFAELVMGLNSIVLKSISTFKVKPIISKITYYDRVDFTGTLNYNCNFLQSEKYHLSVIIVSKDHKMEIQKDIVVSGNNFEFSLDKEDIVLMKEYSPEIWSLYLEIEKYGDEVIRQRLKFKESKKKSLLTKSLLFDNDNINFKAYLTKAKNELVIQSKNNITITKILYVFQKNNTLEIKYRTKENIENLLDEKLINTTIFNDFGTFNQKKIKKIGKQTFISYYKGDNVEEFITEAKKRGIKIQIKTNQDTCMSYIKELDLDTLYLNQWEKIQRTKKYKKMCDILYNKIFLKMPMKKNRIMFESFLGRNISGNPKYLYNQLVEDNLDKQYELIWILNNLEEPLEGNGKKVKRKSLTYYYYMATSRYWIFNCRQADEIKKRKGNIYLQTWHGTPLKKLGMDMDNVSMAGQTDINDYKRKFYNNSRRWDYLLAQNSYSREIFKSAFSFDKTILDGYPANDILYNKNNAKDITELKYKLGVPKDKKVILYAPTWRDDNFYKKGHYRMSIQLDLDKMQKELGNEYVILLRMHYLITNNLDIEKYNGFVYDYSQGYDIQELYLVSDVLITDYSSVMFDYSNLNRPIIFFTYDIEQYRDSLRGFYFDFEKEAPGPLVTDTEGVIKSLKCLGELNKKYSTKKKDFYNKFCHIDNGLAATNILKEILK